MRKFILLVMSLVMITPCDAAVHSVTVEQLKQLLAAQQTAGKNDGDRAQHDAEAPTVDVGVDATAVPAPAAPILARAPR